jgi:hypothetical protein
MYEVGKILSNEDQYGQMVVFVRKIAQCPLQIAQNVVQPICTYFVKFDIYFVLRIKVGHAMYICTFQNE